MTNPAQGRDDATVAALAVAVSALRQDLNTLTARLDTLADQQREQAAVLQAVTELRNRVEAILTCLNDTDKTTPATWFWLTMPEPEQQQKLAELTDWVDTVLRVQYPAYLADQLKPCWPNHPEALWELTWLYQLWTHAYLTRQSTPKDAADWHDRWLPGVIRRLADVLNRCHAACALSPVNSR